MSAIKINDKSKIYVLCPAYTKSGGPELLHQLVRKLNDNDIKAYIVYYNKNQENLEYRNKEFDIYTSVYINIEDIEDNENNVLIMPEVVVAIRESKKFNKIKKVIWWLSVDNFLKGYGIINPLKYYRKYYIKTIFKTKFMFSFNYIRSINYHLCQSEYAIEFLKKKKISNIMYLSDYINDIYFDIEQNELKNKQDIVLYNPKKGLKFTNKLINTSRDLNWIPIQNLTTEEVRKLLIKSKVYIDFGNHPGKDRFPREAVMCGCCIITGKRRFC